MTRLTYASLLNKTLEINASEGSLTAYKFITKYADQVKGNKAQIFNFRYCLASSSGLEQEALSILREAIIENGYWYSYDYISQDDDLKNLHKYKEFQDMMQICKEREVTAQRLTKPQLKVVQSEKNSEVETVIVALHGNQENIDITEPRWKLPSQETILALPQSSSIAFSDAYMWDNVEQGTKELKDHLTYLSENYNVRKEKVIVGGFSAGARVALKAILNDEIECKGYILMGPWLPEIEEWEVLLDRLKKKNSKGYIICGDKDQDCFEGTEKFVSLLEKKEIPYTYTIIEGLTHEYPENFNKHLSDAINYIYNTK
ncbi:alpha/beta hydrolase [Bacillus salitolerans]|uniref:Alpha/beta hydrolase n=1 Tax=Bacillus salitolerans TaxID=1437434 RepID=A0ABW4LX64_9BACI